MDTTQRDWKSLPAEVSHIILEFAATGQSTVEACNVILVCKAWFPAAQAAVYSNITIRSHSHFKKFYNVIINNPHLGVKIKTLFLSFRTYSMEETNTVELSSRLTHLLTTLLPKIEVLRKVDLHSCFPSLHTLLELHLRHLKTLQYPRELMEGENYVKCAFMMKDRLENMCITWSYSELEEEPVENLNSEYQRLYDKLYQFHNLVDINVTENNSDEVKVLEHIVEACRSLKSIKIDPVFFDDDQFNPARSEVDTQSSIDDFIGTLTKYIPRSNVKSLYVSTRGFYGYKLLLYITRKFPQLQKLYIDYQDGEISNFDTHSLAQFLDYVSTVAEFSVSGLFTYQNNLLEAIGNFWDKTSKPGSVNLHVLYSDDLIEEIEASLNISKKVGGGIETTLRYPAHVDFYWRSYMNFIKKSGKYISTMKFAIKVENGPLNRSELSEQFFPHILEYCPNIENLRIEGCVLKRFFNSEVIINNKFSLDELIFRNCKIQHGMLEHLSQLLHNIGELRLCHNSIYFTENELNDEHLTYDLRLQIAVPHTIVDCVMFVVQVSREIIHATVLSDQKRYYYKIDTAEDGWIKSSTEQGCATNNVGQHVLITCQTKPKIDVQMQPLFW